MIKITAIMVTKNEEANILHSLPPLVAHFDEVIVLDSNSEDKTVDIAKDLGATVHNFEWNGQYPKKRQWALENIQTKYDWIFMIDADEIVTPAFINELKSLVWTVDGYFVKSNMVWNGKKLKWGLKNNKLCLFNKSAFYYPVVNDLDISGMGEIEGHYQPVPTAKNETIGQVREPIIHHDHKGNWKARHDNYAQWEIGMNKRNLWPIDPIFRRELIKDFIRTNPLRPHLVFAYSYILKGGFFDGKQGLDYALKRFAYNRRIVREAPPTKKKH